VDVGDRFDKYTIERVLGEGGMATVYLARHDILDSLHALKVLRVDAPSIRKRLMAEGKVQAAIRHPNVVSVTDILEDADSVALVMEYVEGVNLEKRLDAGQGFTPAEALELFRGIAMGIGAAHDQGVVHRDLKPANILLQQTNAGLIPKVTDFGLVKILESSGTQSGVLMGTPEYMSPEQVRDSGKVDTRSDLWSLGALLYELLAGRVAFDHPDVLQVYTAIVNGDYVPLEQVRPGLPSRALAAVHRLLQVDPDDRFQTVDAMLAYLYSSESGARADTRPIPRRRTPTVNSEPQPRPSTDELLSLPPPRPPPPPRTLLLVVTLLLGTSLVAGSVSTALWWWSSDVSPPTREVVVRPTTADGPLPDDAPLRLHVEGLTFHGGRVVSVGRHAPGAELAATLHYGEGCGACPDQCPDWCATKEETLVVPPGRDAAELRVDVPVPPAVSVRLAAAQAERILFDGTELSLSGGEASVDTLPGLHTVVAQRGDCDGAEPDCTTTNTCPDGCASVQASVQVGLSGQIPPVTLELPAVEAPQPTPAPAPVAPTGPPPRVTNSAFAAWLEAHPDWTRDAAIARGAADKGYLRDWTNGTPPGPATRLSWSAAKAYCGTRGGLRGLDEEPLTWPQGTIVMEWRVTPDGGIAWRRFDGVTSTKATPDQTSFATAARCRR